MKLTSETGATGAKAAAWLKAKDKGCAILHLPIVLSWQQLSLSRFEHPFLFFFLASLLPFFLSSFLPFFLSSFLPFFLSSFLPFFLSCPFLSCSAVTSFLSCPCLSFFSTDRTTGPEVLRLPGGSRGTRGHQEDGEVTQAELAALTLELSQGLAF